MKITAIKQQQKQINRYSIFVEGKYSFSLSEAALLESKLATGQELSKQQVSDFKQESADDKLYSLALRYVAVRLRSEWEIKTYLEHKKVSPALVDTILNKLRVINLIDDENFAKTFVDNHQLLRPTSRRKLNLKLRQKCVSDEIIKKVLAGIEPENEQITLQAVIESKRRQAKYQDDLKLMQYLARQGFSYGDIKEALNK